MAIYGEFSHETLWFSIAMLVYQRVTCINHPIIGGTQFWPKAMSEANLQHLCGIGDVPHPGWSCRQLLNQPRSRRKRQHGDGKWGAWSCSCCLPFWDVVCVLVNVCFFCFAGMQPLKLWALRHCELKDIGIGVRPPNLAARPRRDAAKQLLPRPRQLLHRQLLSSCWDLLGIDATWLPTQSALRPSFGCGSSWSPVGFPPWQVADSCGIG